MKSKTKYLVRPPNGFFARPADWDDLEEMTIVANLDAEQAFGAADTEESEFRLDWESEEFDNKRDSQLIFDSEERLLGFVQVFNEEDPPAHPYLWMRTLPGYTDHVVGDFLLYWGETRSRLNLGIVPEELRVTMRAHNVQGYAPLGALFERHAMKITRHGFQMRIDLEGKPKDVKWPQGISINPFDPEKDMEDFFRANEEGFADHFGHVHEDFDVAFPRWKFFVTKDEGYDPDLWFIAREGDEIAGVARCRKWSWEDKELGWISELSVRRPWRKRGLGLALLQHCFQVYHERGINRVGLGVDAESLTGATRLYEKAGMHVHRVYERYEKELRPGIENSKTELD